MAKIRNEAKLAKRKKSSDGKCPDCDSKRVNLLVGCHIGSIYPDILECVSCGCRYDCHQQDYYGKVKIEGFYDRDGNYFRY